MQQDVQQPNLRNILHRFPNLQSLKLVNFEQPQDVLKEVNPTNDDTISINLRLDHCQTGKLTLLGLPFTTNGLHFDHEDHIPTRDGASPENSSLSKLEPEL